MARSATPGLRCSSSTPSQAVAAHASRRNEYNATTAKLFYTYAGGLRYAEPCLAHRVAPSSLVR